MNTKKKIALVAAASMLSVGGLYIATTANAATPNAPAVASLLLVSNPQSQTQLMR